MSDEIRVGDEFEIRVRVTALVEASVVHATVIGAPAAWNTRYNIGELLAGRRLPRAIKVGDRVTWPADARWSGTVVYVADEWAVVHPSTYCSRPLTVTLSDLTPIPGDEK